MNTARYLILLLLSIFASGCEPAGRPARVAEKHCSACHLFPEPAMLDKATWSNQVLPEMAFRMGLDVSKLPHTNAAEMKEILLALPANPLVSEEEWQAIRRYYLNNAPDSLHIAKQTVSSLDQFTASTVTLPVSGRTSLTMVRADPVGKKVFAGTRGGKLYVLSPSFTVEDSVQIGSPPSDLLLSSNQLLVSAMGIMDPNDRRAGSVFQLDTRRATHTMLIDSIKRPVDLVKTDLNGDKTDDLIVSAFGNFTGGLFAYESNNHTYTQHAIHDFPGNRKSIARDFNNDGLPDIMALITQGDERIALFTNRGNFRFSYQVLLKFPAVYGSSYFALHDFNGDGHPDILYTNGDNADYSMILKPYHGVRIFLNDGRNKFSEYWHHPMHGASMAKAVDFDQDGDLDIAAIAFFPDFKKHPEHGFIYFENQEGKFVPHATPVASAGRWITMETADMDEDGDEDIVLAALNFPTGVPQIVLDHWNKNRASLLLLKNNHK